MKHVRPTVFLDAFYTHLTPFISTEFDMFPYERARGLLFSLGMSLPILYGALAQDYVRAAFMTLGALLALLLDPRSQALKQMAAIVIGVLAVIVSAAFGLTLVGHSQLAIAALMIFGFLAGQPKPEHAYWGLLGKYLATALLLAQLGFPASASIGIAYFAGALLALMLILLQGWMYKTDEIAHSPNNEFFQIIKGDTNGPLYGLTLPLTILAATISADWMHVTQPGWVGLTILFVMHIDDRLSWHHLWDRILGTLLGILIAYIAVRYIDQIGLAIVVALFAFWIPYSLRKSYLLFSLVITVTVMVAINFALLPKGDLQLMSWRFLDTLIGCFWVAIALIMTHGLHARKAKLD
ncbi:FUSC family protein [Enterovibrio norvegicus]|uniref:FUSC family protein n=1 Tax=Enterovibrio norvegicus TaxID=188144 RepID=UPI001F517AD9|nr:FUSC family protein [Enterovibrio norvegicus]